MIKKHNTQTIKSKTISKSHTHNNWIGYPLGYFEHQA